MSHPPWGQLLAVQFYGTRTFHGYAERELVNYDFFSLSICRIKAQLDFIYGILEITSNLCGSPGEEEYNAKKVTADWITRSQRSSVPWDTTGERAGHKEPLKEAPSAFGKCNWHLQEDRCSFYPKSVTCACVLCDFYPTYGKVHDFKKVRMKMTFKVLELLKTHSTYLSVSSSYV